VPTVTPDVPAIRHCADATALHRYALPIVRELPPAARRELQNETPKEVGSL
jgi:hypothetical protein